MSNALSLDEFEAMAEVARGLRSRRLSIRVARNAKRLCGLKYLCYNRSGYLQLTDQGREALFHRQCLDVLRQLTRDPLAQVDSQALQLLLRKGHAEVRDGEPGHHVTAKGAEVLQDYIDRSR